MNSLGTISGHCYHGPLCAESVRHANVSCGLCKERPAVSATRDLPAQCALTRPFWGCRVLHLTSPASAWARTRDVQNIPVVEKPRTHAGTFVKILFCFDLFCFVLILVLGGGGLATPHGIRDLSSPTRDGTCAAAVEAQSPNHWTAKEFPR